MLIEVKVQGFAKVVSEAVELMASAKELLRVM